MNVSLIILLSSFVGALTVFMVISAVLQDKIRRIAISTHAIVNNERSVMLVTIANQAEVIAKAFPLDAGLQRRAVDAREEADKSLRKSE